MNITLASRKDIGDTGSPYINNKAPLAAGKLIKLPLGQVKPKGWIRHQLDLMVNGMTGRLEELSPFLKEDNGWFQDGSPGWEEQPYWLRGFYALAVLTQDERCLKTAQHWIERVIDNQAGDGWFGSSYHRHRSGTGGRAMCDLWGHMVMCDALQLHYEYTGDGRVIALLSRFFEYCAGIPDDQFIPLVQGAQWQEYREDFGDWKVGVQMKRAGEILTNIYWLYNRTGEKALLELATRFYQRILPPVSEFLDNHVVNFVQRYGYAAWYGQQADLAQGLKESEYWYSQHMSVWGQQPRGAYGADEVIRSGKVDPRQGMETCAMIEFCLKFYELGRITGNPLYADRCEDLLLNHFPAAQTPDLKGLHYLTASNLPQLDAGCGHDFWNEEMARGRGDEYPMLSYSPHRYRCCQHNVAMGWPFYAQNLWQASADGGLVAWLYGASDVVAETVAGPVRVVQDTDYPFDETISLAVSDGGGVFPLYLRVPHWCRNLALTVNGEEQCLQDVDSDFIRIERDWSLGDRVSLKLGMKLSRTRWPRTGAVTVDRGPLSYSIRIEEEWRRCGGTDEWPEWEVLPKSPWNYGLALDAIQHAEIEKKASVSEQPWSVEANPIELHLPARRIQNWKLEDGGSVQELRKSPIRTNTEKETITLVPMGCARLRMSCLPVVADTPEAREWSEFKNC